MIQPPRILVAGIGNIFLGDDAFGVHVAQRLAKRQFSDDVSVVDFGIRGLDLAYALSNGCEVAILIDAVPRGQAPGTLYIIEPQIQQDAAPVAIEGHSIDPVKVLRLARDLGANPKRVLLVGCEPSPFEPDAEISGELSTPVAAAVEEAAKMVESLIAEFSVNSLSMETSCT